MKFAKKSLTFSGLIMCSKPIFCSKVAQKERIFSRLLEPQKVAANAKSCSKVVKHNRERPYYLNTQNQLRCRVSPKLTVQFTSKKEHSLNNMIKSLRYVLGHSRLSDFSLILLRDGRASKSRECARTPTCEVTFFSIGNFTHVLVTCSLTFPRMMRRMKNSA